VRWLADHYEADASIR